MKDIPVGALYGVGPARVRAFARLGVETVEQLLHHYPRAYEYRGDIKRLSTCSDEAKSAVLLTVATAPRLHLIKRGMSLLKFRSVEDGSGDVCEITYFNQNYLKDTFTVGQTYRFFGKVERRGGGFVMTSPAYELVVEGQEDRLPPLLPVYPATEGLSQKQISSAVTMALRMAMTDEEMWEDPLPDELRRKRGLCAYSYALRNIHHPTSPEALAVAKTRLVYDELYLFALGLATTRSRTKNATAPACTAADPAPLEAILPYRLTGAQQRAIGEIQHEMMTSTPMSRMLVGDVGCGKTVCAAAAILFAVQSGYQAALMAPTEILARQHYADLSAWLERLHIRCELLIGATTASKKRAIRAALAEGSLSVVIGTQALLTEGVEFSMPALMVTDEQHRFGVGQRATLSEKNHFAHLLVMSATPIPRSLALGLYGDLDVSRIDEMPPGRQTVDTFVVDEGYRARLNAFIQKQVAQGGQVYVVCPAIEEREMKDAEGMHADVYLEDVSVRGEDIGHTATVEMKNAISHAEYLSRTLQGCTVACLHGKMKATQKDEIMQRFVRGEVQVLVSTTVIEVGVNVPNASLMMIENAERFGLSQLHQLRGRVGRGSRKSYCVLIHGERTGEVARQRLEVMRTERDGFEIARRDLALRGPGDFLRGSDGTDSIRQSGGIHFRLADTCDDTELLERAMQDARELISADPTLADHPSLRRRMERMFTPTQGTIS